MARLPRLSIAGLPHLLLQRGHNRQPVCADEADAQQFTQWLAESSRSYGVALHAYALRSGDLRLLATPADAAALGRMMQSLGRRYGAFFNRRHARIGGLWEGRFRATVLEPERHLLEAMAWVETHGAAPFNGASSYAHHVGQAQAPLVSDHPLYWSLGNTPFERELAYRRYADQGLAPAALVRLEAAVQQGWPLGSAGFVAGLAAVTERRLMPLPKGRPKQANEGGKDEAKTDPN